MCLNFWLFQAGCPNPRAVHLINDRRGCIVDLTNVCQLGHQNNSNDGFQEIKTYHCHIMSYHPSLLGEMHQNKIALTFFDAMDTGYNSQ